MNATHDSTTRRLVQWEPCRLSRPGLAAALILFGISLTIRLLWLGRVPGLNGDEGWYGSQVVRMLHGRSWSAMTPSRLPINPQLFCTEAGLLLFAEPSGFVLRLPIAIWAIGGVALTYFLHRWVYDDRAEALLVSLVTACLPAHLAYARFCWDASFSVISVPLVLYATLRIAEGRGSVWSWALLAGGSVLVVWTHATHAVFVASSLVVLVGVWLRPWFDWARATAAQRRRAGALAGGLMLVGCTVWFWDTLVWFVARGDVWLVDRCQTGWRAVTTWIDLITGLRVYEYLAGMPRPNWVNILYAVVLLASAGAAIVLLRTRRTADRALVVLFPISLAMLLAPMVSEKLRFGSLSYERYVFYLVPLSVAAFVRSLRSAFAQRTRWASVAPVVLSIVCASSFLVQFWFNYMLALDRLTHWERIRDTAQRTFATGPAEPKSAAAAAILQIGSTTNSTLYVEDWSLHGPLEYLLDGRIPVKYGPVRFDTDARIFVVGYSHHSFIAEARDRLARAEWRVTERAFCDRAARPIISLLSCERSRDESSEQ
jgi:hypothetical protein